jgi:hypothetical protein
MKQANVYKVLERHGIKPVHPSMRWPYADVIALRAVREQRREHDAKMRAAWLKRQSPL